MERSNSQIYGNATIDQRLAIDHIGSHARLLAGPGTGKTKTLTHRVLSLILQHKVDPESIILLTFTRKAAAQLRFEITAVLAPLKKAIPHVSTLHSFALKQILHNSSRVETLPKPIRIADDWEERHIIQEDLKSQLKLEKIDQVRKLINQLSTDWETLRIDEIGWEEQFPNAAFLGAWRSHKQQYGETLRAELVYQLKRQLNQTMDFVLDREYKHALIDEYQDLNACDLAIINELAKRGAKLFVTGDDDQSIYGFRYASPAGIRNFDQIYPDVKKMALEICFRCDKNILHSAEFVASLDPTRLPKPTRPRADADDGTVLIVCFENQNQEASAIAAKTKQLIDAGTAPSKIAILFRSDKDGAMSAPIIECLKKQSVEISLATDSKMENLDEYRRVLSLIRIMVDKNDSLAWRTLTQVSRNGLGQQKIKKILEYSQGEGIRFGAAIQKIANKPRELEKHGQKISDFVGEINDVIEKVREKSGPKEMITEIIEAFVSDSNTRQEIEDYFIDIFNTQADTSLEELIKAISASSERIEQETKENAVSILTMHQAKGLTFDTCFIVAAENEVIPGKNLGEREGDERRLLYVSMTRAKHNLFISYCRKRTGRQSFLGSKSGTFRRTLTKFLVDSKITIKLSRKPRN